MKYILSAILLRLLLLSAYACAQGDLLITPNRLVFNGGKTKEELSLINIGKDTTTFSVSLVHYRMQENGSFRQADANDPDSVFADKYLRIFPRRVTLAPGESQVVFVQCRRISEIPSGEYRSHIYFRSEKNYKPLGMEGKSDTTLMSVQLIPIYGITIPAIVRAGNLQASAGLQNLNLEKSTSGNYSLGLDIVRSGNMSLYGNIKAEFVPVDGKTVELGVVQGVGVYPEISKRRITIPLRTGAMTNLANGVIRVTYSGADAGCKALITSQELQIQ